jgi:DNA replication protein DnaD
MTNKDWLLKRLGWNFSNERGDWRHFAQQNTEMTAIGVKDEKNTLEKLLYIRKSLRCAT